MRRVRTKKPLPASPPSSDRAHPMAELVGAVTPLGGKERVARLRDRVERKHDRILIAAPARKSFEFVIQRDGLRIDGHRADLRTPRVAPGHGRTWTPEVRLDLHGVRARELEVRLAVAIRECARCPAGRLLVIHGKGLHSAGGAGVLAEAVVELLATPQLARFIRAFATAPARLGGSGALAVELEL